MVNFLSIILSFLVLIILILMVVKFFQIARDVQEISKLLSLQQKKDAPKFVLAEKTEVDDIKEGSHVVESKTGNQMRVMGILEDDTGEIKFNCSPNGGITIQMYNRGEIELFETFYRK